MYRLIQKCKLLKRQTKNWVATRFGNISRQLIQVEKKLNKLQSQIVAQGTSVSLGKQQQLLLTKHANLLEFQNEHWKVRAKSNNLKLGDANTKYYHACASIRRNRNLISSVVDNANNVVINPKKVEECFTNAFRSRFLSNQA